jgi:hypothetical protein
MQQWNVLIGLYANQAGQMSALKKMVYIVYHKHSIIYMFAPGTTDSSAAAGSLHLFRLRSLPSARRMNSRTATKENTSSE